MPRETIEQKAARYLAEGRVRVVAVDAVGVRAHVRGAGHLYRVEGRPVGGWRCTCPAVRRCAHRVAVELVAAFTNGAVS